MGTGVLALGLKKLLVLLKGHGELLLTSKLISKTSSINHSSGGLLLRKSSLIGHLIKISLELVEFRLKLPSGSSNGLVDIAKVSKILIGVSEFLLSSTSLSVSSLKEGTALLKAVLHSSSLSVSSNLGIGSSRLGLGLTINLGLGISDLELVLLDGGLGLSIAINRMLKSKSKISGIKKYQLQVRDAQAKVDG